MDFYYVMAGGTRESGASDANGWVASNAYATIQDALDETAAGDMVVVDDGDWVVASDIVSTALGYDGQVTIRSRSMDPLRASIKSSSATVGVFRTLNTSNIQDFLVWGFTLGKTVTHTGSTAAPIWQAAQQTGNIHLKNCIIDGVFYDSNRNGAGGLFNQASAASGGRALILEDCKIRNILFKNSASTSYLASCNTGNTLRILGTLEIDNIVASGINFGGFNCSGPIDIQGEIKAGAIVVEGSGSSVALLNQQTTSTSCRIRKITGTGIVATHSTARAALLDLKGPYDIGTVRAEDVTVRTSTVTAGLGGAIVVGEDTGTGTIKLLEAIGVTSNYGAALYLTQGGSAEVDRIFSDRCAAFMGIVYKGGDGDLTVHAYECRDPRYLTDIDLLPDEAKPGGLALYSHAHSSAARICKTVVHNMTAVANVPLPLVHVRNNQDTYAHELEIDNSIIWNELSAAQIVASSSPEATDIDLTVSHSGLRGGVASIVNRDAVSLNVTTAAITADDPALNSERIATSPSYIEAGRAVAKARRLDIGGHPFRNPPTLGAREFLAA